MFFIQWMDTASIESWDTIDEMGLNLPLPVPPMITYSFDYNANSFHVGNLSDMIDLYKGKARNSPKSKIPLNIKNEFIKKLTAFESNHLLDLYVQRLIFDGFIGFGKIHGIPSDIDLIINAKVKNELIFLEVKEKDLSKGNPKGFGMDVPRIQAIVQLSSTTQIPVFYIVRQVNNQSDRLFLNWRYINMHVFKSHLNETLIEGGSGMGYENGSYPTQICPEKYFCTMGDIT